MSAQQGLASDAADASLAGTANPQPRSPALDRAAGGSSEYAVERARDVSVVWGLVGCHHESHRRPLLPEYCAESPSRRHLGA